MARSSAFATGFPEAQVRQALTDTMLMGMPDDVSQRLTWFWERNRTWSPEDPAGNPYDWSAAPVADNPTNPALPDTGSDQSLQVPYALEFSARPSGSENTVFGEIDTSRAVVTLLDVHYQKIKTADYAVIGAVHYFIQFTAPPTGLFGLTVWQAFLQAQDSA